MLLWVGFAVLTAAVVAVLLRPLLAGGSDAAPSGAEVGGSDLTEAAVYRDQLAEIEAERGRGLIGEGEAEAARVEIARRLLGTAEAKAAVSPGAAAGSIRLVTMLVAAALPLLTIASYLALGAPGRSGQPFAERGSQPGSAPGVAQLIARVEERLREHPEDGRGWDVIAPVYMRLGRYGEAADAFQRAIRLLGENPARLAGLAESHVLGGNGVVTEAARAAYERLRVLEPDRVEPRFWLAVAAEQDGRLEDAATAYGLILAEGDPEAGWRPTVVERWRKVRTRLGLAADTPPKGGETASSPSPATPSTTGSEGAQAPALTRETVEAVQALSPEARRQMIEDMVAGLDKRLSQDGRDLDGWQRLIRAYAVLGRRDEALSALARARAALAEEAQSLETLATLARTLGLAS